MIGNAVEAVRPAFDRACVVLSPHVPDVSTVIDGDATRLEQVVLDLLDNALKYSPPSATVDVVLTENEDAALLRISNEGPAIPSESRARIFEPFFREPGARVGRPGHGLGLPLARAVARAHRGDVTLLSPDNLRHTFELRLPLAIPA